MAQGRRVDRRTVLALLDDPARAAVAGAALEHVHGGAVVGLGSGRAVWATMELLARRDELVGLRVVAASSATEALAGAYGFRLVELDGTLRPDVYLDGADEVTEDMGLLKGHGGALLREKLIAVSARRFVVIAEASKRVERLGQQRTLPVEVVRFGWPDTRRRLREAYAQVSLRTDGDAALVTDEGHHLLEVDLPADVDATAVADHLDATVGVVEHGLFLDHADEVLLGRPSGHVEVLRRAGRRGPGGRT